MICATCFGPVEWKGPLSNLIHTECLDCGMINNQIVDECESDDEQAEGGKQS
jgi:hypothetical protein